MYTRPSSHCHSPKINYGKAGKKKGLQGCADIGALYKLLQGQVIGGISTGSVHLAVQERVRSRPSLSFNDVVVEMVARKQEDTEPTIAVTKKSRLVYFREEVLAPSLLALQTAIRS